MSKLGNILDPSTMKSLGGMGNIIKISCSKWIPLLDLINISKLWRKVNKKQLR